jgi:hypothetical protein
MTFRAVSRLTFQPQEDPNRISVDAELVGDAPAPSMGTIIVSVQTQIWVGDNPTWQQLHLRVIDTLSRSFALPNELRHQLGSVYEADQTPAAATP